jgi:hypothetical protein
LLTPQKGETVVPQILVPSGLGAGKGCKHDLPALTRRMISRISRRWGSVEGRRAIKSSSCMVSAAGETGKDRASRLWRRESDFGAVPGDDTNYPTSLHFVCCEGNTMANLTSTMKCGSQEWQELRTDSQLIGLILRSCIHLLQHAMEHNLVNQGNSDLVRS